MFSALVLLLFSSFIIVSTLTIDMNMTHELSVTIEYVDNETLILLYNLTTNVSYFITFRLFGREEEKFGIFLPTFSMEQRSLEIFDRYSSKSLGFFIVCFHFLQLHIDILCKDIRLSSDKHLSTIQSDAFLPSYNPLFVPMMYALSILMLLPVIVQHHRRKQEQILLRRTQIRRLSLTIANDSENPQQQLAKQMLEQVIESGKINYAALPTDIELVSFLSPSNTMTTNGSANSEKIEFAPLKIRSSIRTYDDEEPGMSADDCIAHLLNSTPWNSPSPDQIPIVSTPQTILIRDNSSTSANNRTYHPIGTSFRDVDDDDGDDDRRPILKQNPYCTVNLFRSNPGFIESDV